MTKICDAVLIAKVQKAYEFSQEQGGVFDRQAAAGYLKLVGFTFDRAELGAAVKVIAEKNGVTRSRVTFKDSTINMIGENIHTLDDLAEHLRKHEIDPTDREVFKYKRYIELAQRLRAKYEDAS